MASTLIRTATAIIALLLTVGAADVRSEYQQYKDALRAEMERPHAVNQKLNGLLDDLYRPGAKIGSGSTASALRYEQATGAMVGGKDHAQKAVDYASALEKWLKDNPLAKQGDIAAAENVLQDLRNAVNNVPVADDALASVSSVRGELKAAEAALAACGIPGPGRGLLSVACSFAERRTLARTVGRLREQVRSRFAASLGRFKGQGAALAERLGVGAGSRASQVAGGVGKGFKSVKSALGDGLRAAGKGLEAAGKVAAWLQAGHSLAENIKDQAKFNDEVKDTGVVDDDKLTNLAYGYTTDLLLGHGGTRSAVGATKSCFADGSWSCAKKIGSGIGHFGAAVGKASANCITHPWECTKSIGSGIKDFAVGVARWTKSTGEGAGDRVFKWVDEAERKKSCGRQRGTFDKVALGATGGLYGERGRFTEEWECQKVDREEKNWRKAWKNWALDKGDTIDQSKYNPLNWFKGKNGDSSSSNNNDKRKKTESPVEGSKWNPINWLRNRSEAKAPTVVGSSTGTAATEAPKSLLSKINPINWFGNKEEASKPSSSFWTSW